MRDYEAMKMIQRLIVSLQLAWNKRTVKSMLEVLVRARHELDLIIKRLEKK